MGNTESGAWRRRRSLEGGMVKPIVPKDEDSHLDDDVDGHFELRSPALNPEEALIAAEEARDNGTADDREERAQIPLLNVRSKGKGRSGSKRVVGMDGIGGILLTKKGEKIPIRDIPYPEDLDRPLPSQKADDEPYDESSEIEQRLDKDHDRIPPEKTYFSLKEAKRLAEDVRIHRRRKRLAMPGKPEETDRGNDSVQRGA